MKRTEKRERYRKLRSELALVKQSVTFGAGHPQYIYFCILPLQT